MANHEKLDINEVKFDVENPRIARFMAMYKGEISGEKIALALNQTSTDPESTSTADSGTTYRSLKNSIKSSGTIIQPIHVDRKSNGEMIVIEGNTRLAIYRELYESTNDDKWASIPALVYDNLSRLEIDQIRLQSHQVGPRPWDPYSKAKFLKKLSDSDHIPMHLIIDFCGGRQREIEEYIAAYDDMEKYFRPISDGAGAHFDQTRFSAFVELQNAGVKKSIIENGFDLSDFSQWVFDKKIYPLNTVRSLTAVLANKEARSTFLNKNIKEALRLLDSKVTSSENLSDASLLDLFKITAKKLRAIQYKEVKDMQDDPNCDLSVALLDLKNELDDIAKNIITD